MTAILIGIIYLSFIALGLPDSLLGSSWALMHTELGAPTSTAGQISFVVSLFTILSSFMAGRLLQKYGTQKITVVSVLFTAVALFGYSFAPSIYWIYLFAVFLGSGAGAVDAALSNYVALYLKAKHMSFLHASWGIGAVGGSFIIAYVLTHSTWRMGYMVVSSILFLITLSVILSKRLWKEEKLPEEEKKIISNREAFRKKGVKSTMVTLLAYNGAELTCGVWIATYFIRERGITPSMAAIYYSLFCFGIIMGRLSGGVLSARLGDQKLIRFGALIGLLGGILFILPLPTPVTVFALFLLGLGGGPVYPSVVHAAPKRFGKDYSPAVISLELTGGYIGSTFVPLLSGYVAGALGMHLIPWILLGLYVILLISTEMTNKAFK